jgi:hypothetical protein
VKVGVPTVKKGSLQYDLPIIVKGAPATAPIESPPVAVNLSAVGVGVSPGSERASLESSPTALDEGGAPPEGDAAAFNRASVGDRAAEKDLLGFEPYVQAVAEFLADARTEPPLTISIEGEWGAGKTSFMKQLERELKDRGIVSVWFNPWRHDKDESLWAAFALEFPKALARLLYLPCRLICALRLWFCRLRWLENWNGLIIFLLRLTVYVSVIVFLSTLYWYGQPTLEEVINLIIDSKHQGKDPNQPGRLLTWWGGSAVAFYGVLQVFRWMKEQVGSPLTIDLKKYVGAPDYASRVSFVERFHEDFNKITSVYVGKSKLCVFIDDLDRCEAPKSAELMQALNLMIPDSRNLVFVLGMNRQRVAAAVAVKHEKILPFLVGDPADQPHSLGGKEKREVAPASALAYGYEFLEKFVQIPVRLPQPTNKGIELLLKELLKPTAKPAQPNPASYLAGKVRTSHPGEDISPLKEKLEQLELEIAKMVAPALDYNPRRLKQFVNCFRLRAYMAYLTGILDITQNDSTSQRLSLHQIGKFVAISLRWPMLISALDDDPLLLRALQGASIRGRRSPSPLMATKDALGNNPTVVLDVIAGIPPDRGSAWSSSCRTTPKAGPSDDDKSAAFVNWSKCRELMELLYSGCDHAEGEARCSLERADLSKLIQISPRRQQPSRTP